MSFIFLFRANVKINFLPEILSHLLTSFEETFLKYFYDDQTEVSKMKNKFLVVFFMSSFSLAFYSFLFQFGLKTIYLSA